MMKKQAQDFARYGHFQGMMARHDLYRLETYGERIYGLDGEYTNIVFATDAFGRILVAEAFSANINEYNCLLSSWFYTNIIGGAAPAPEPENQVPLVLWNKADQCQGPRVFACSSVVDNNQDIGCEMFIGKVVEPHIFTPYPYIWNYYRDMISGPVRMYNIFLEAKRMNIEARMSGLMYKFPILQDPRPGFEGKDPGYPKYNTLLELLCMIHNLGVTEESPSCKNIEDQNRLQFAENTENGLHGVEYWAIKHVT